nr:TetR family transcriptional regulator C-terminal domain-containing protein [Aliamphritea spongicola]
MIWASTQTYADFSTQICLVMKKDELEETDYQGASDFIANVILKGVGLR